MHEPTRSLRRKLLAPILAIAGLGIAFVGVVGFAHTEAGRPLLRYIPGMGTSCPVGMDAVMTADARDRVRASALASLRTGAPAGSRHAFAFALDETDLPGALAWAQRHGLDCAHPVRPGGELQLRCTDVPAEALGRTFAADTLLLQFDRDQRLVAADASGHADDPTAAAAFVRTRAEQLEQSAGAPASTNGEATDAHLGRGALSQATVEFAFEDLRARVVATNMGHGEFVLRELYQSLRS